jgi:protein archease
MKRFELVDISGDAGIVAFGRNIKELFRKAAAGMYSLIIDVESIEEKKTVDIAVGKDSLEGLLVAWLNELIFRFDVDGFIAKKIVITGLSISPEAVSGTGAERAFTVNASLSGEDFDPARHKGKLLLKAATYHDLRIVEEDEVWRSRIIFDV